MGREFNDPNVQKLIKTFPFSVKEDDNRLKIAVNYKGEEKLMLPEEISAIILKDLKKSAEAYLGTKITKAVITVPAYFNNAQRQSTLDAAAIAELEVIKLINEPTAAALAYGFHNRGKKTILIYDFGGGTFDVSLLRMNNEDLEVLKIDGDSNLGGEDLDNAVVEHFAEKFEEDDGYDVYINQSVLRLLKSRCEEVKRCLSSAPDATFVLDGTHLRGEITRALFEEINYDYFNSTIELVDKVIKEAKLYKKDIDDIVLVGGSSRIPKVQKLLQNYFDNKPLNRNINPDECVAMGAAIQAAMRSETPIPQFRLLKLSDVCPLSLGFKLNDGTMHVVIPRNSRIPTKATKFVQPASNNQTSVEVEVFEGERFLCKDNHFLGSFVLENIPEDGSITVNYEIDENSILSVKAIEKETKVSNEIKIENKGRLAKEEIEKFISDAKKHAKDDQIEAERIICMNDYEEYLYTTRRSAKRSFKKDEIAEKTYLTIVSEIDKRTSWLNDNRQVEKDIFLQLLDEFKLFVNQHL